MGTGWVGGRLDQTYEVRYYYFITTLLPFSKRQSVGLGSKTVHVRLRTVRRRGETPGKRGETPGKRVDVFTLLWMDRLKNPLGLLFNFCTVYYGPCKIFEL